ncbi:MAG: ABC transporter permease [Lachnospiraceae bacterium]|nr:ABC transporter permease [Lachnospiraceae bacterium]
MYIKLALRNAKRSAKDYLIYIVTLTICVTLFYAFLSISSSFYKPDIGQEFNIRTLGNLMKAAILLITLLLIFLVQYVNRFMFYRRQKEFAVQCIMGMEQGVVAWLFFLETLVIGTFVLVIGIFLGAVCSQFVTALLLQMFHKPFQFSVMLFPDTVLLTVLFFFLCFAFIGLFQVRAIQKTKIIDMLHADWENEGTVASDKWISHVIALNLILHLGIGFYGIRTLTYYLTPQYSTTVQIWSIDSIAAPWVMLAASLLWRFFSKNRTSSQYLYVAGVVSILELLLMGLLPVFKFRFSLPMDTGAYNIYIAFLVWCVVFIASAFFFLFSKWIAALKEKSVKVRYQGENLFFFGQVLSKLNTNTKSMTVICLTLTVSIALFLLTPVLVGWAQGFLDKRTPYDIQMYSGYAQVENIENLPQSGYQFVDAFLEEHGIVIADNCSFRTYFLNNANFYDGTAADRTDVPVTAIALSSYNKLLAMLGYEPISLSNNEYATQWLSTTNNGSIEQFLAEHTTISTDAGELKLSSNLPLKNELGETLYGYQNSICIVPDSVCVSLTAANTFRFIKTEDPLSYTASEELEILFYGYYSEVSGGAYYNIDTSTQEINNTTSAIFVMQTALIYSAIVLFVICFTILALQQLCDAGKYKCRFQILRNMGIEEDRIHSLILKQLELWFGLPVGVSIILAGVFFIYLLFSFSTQIAVYIGTGTLLRQVIITLSILAALLVSYFISTLELFNKSVSK